MALGRFSQFLKRRRDGESPRIRLAAFGKHPGWNDHIDDIGLRTELLVDVKQWLYLQGIAGNVDAGAWEKLADDQRLDGFAHVFCCLRGGQVVLGHLWSSRDGKGRRKYPMIVCAQCQSLPLDRLFRQVLPQLTQLENDCVATTAAADVLRLMDEAQQRLDAVAEAPVGDVSAPPTLTSALRRRAEALGGGEDAVQSLLRSLYAIDREIAAHVGEDGDREVRPVHLRLPAEAELDGLIQRLSDWLAILDELLPSEVPRLLINRRGEPWLDLVAGRPGAGELLCLRAGTVARPPVSQVPYEIPEAFAERYAAVLGLLNERSAKGFAVSADTPATMEEGEDAANHAELEQHGPHAAGAPTDGDQFAESDQPPMEVPAKHAAPVEPPAGASPPVPNDPSSIERPDAHPDRGAKEAKTRSSEPPAELMRGSSPPVCTSHVSAPRETKANAEPPSAKALSAPWPVLAITGAVVVGVVLLVALIFGMMGDGPTSDSPNGGTTAQDPKNGSANGGAPPSAEEFDAERWRRLVAASHRWADALVACIAEAPADSPWHTHPYLSRRVTEPISNARRRGLTLDPRQIIGRPDAILADLAQGDPPAAARTRDAALATRDALALIDRINQMLAPDRIQTTAGGSLVEVAARFEQRGWISPANQINDALSALPLKMRKDRASHVESIVALGDDADALEDTWQQLVAAARTVAVTDAPLLRDFPVWLNFEARRLGQETGVQEMNERLLTRVKPLTDRLSSYVTNEWIECVNRHAARPALAELTDADATDATSYERWLSTAEAYHTLETDPRDDVVWPEEFAAIVDQLLPLRVGAAEKAGNIDKAIAALREQVYKLDALPAVRRYRPRIESQLAAVLDQRDRLVDQIDELAATQTQAALAWLERAGNTKLADVSLRATATEFARRRDALLVDLDADALRVDPRPAFARHRLLNQLTRAMNRLDELLSHALISGPANVEPNDEGWEAAVASWLAGQRELAARRVVEQLAPSSGVPRVNDKALAKPLAEHAAAYSALRMKAGQLIANFRQLEHSLDGFEPLEEIELSDGRDWPVAAKAWTEEQAFKENRAALKPLIEATARLERIAAMPDVASVTKIALSDAPLGERLAARRRLAELDDGGWPTDLSQLQQAAEIDASLRKSPDLPPAFGEQLRAHQPQLWLTCARQATEPDVMYKLLGMRDRFGVDDANLPAALRYNLALHSLREAAAAKNADGRRLVAAFVKNVPAELADRESISSFVAALKQIAKQGADINVESIHRWVGPTAPPLGDAAFTLVDSTDPANFRRYRWKVSDHRVHELVFVRIDTTSADATPFYLCTTELSFGLFRDIVDHADQWSLMLELMNVRGSSMTRTSDSRRGPRVWVQTPNRKALETSDRWLFTHPRADRPYPAGIRVRPPGDDHPVQYLNAQGAMFTAWLLGCRLPKATEWVQALAAVKAADAKPNIRDQNWAKHYQHVERLRQAGPNLEWPYEDSFQLLVSLRQRGQTIDVTASSEVDDDSIWLRPIPKPADPVFHDMIGNVAEYVYHGPAIDTTDASSAAKQIAKAISDPAVKLEVVGGSALASPALETGRAYPIRATAAQHGFSDVGVRLAFSSPRLSVIQRVRQLLLRQSYFYAAE